MPKYKVETMWIKRSNGISTYNVEADSEEEAEKNYRKGDRIEHCVKQDYSEVGIQSITKEYEKKGIKMTKIRVHFEDADGKELIAIAVFEPSKDNDPGMAFDSLYVEEILDVSDEEERSIIEKYEDIILNEAEKKILAW